ncbi:MAG: hypothetical protein ACOYMD_14535 [Paludibacter sp.]
MMAIIAILLYVNLLFGASPKKNPNQMAIALIEKISADVILTDSQKIFIQTKALEYATNRQTANSKADKTEKAKIKKEAFESYKAILDSILTVQQKSELKAKQNERHVAIINKIKTNK